MTTPPTLLRRGASRSASAPVAALRTSTSSMETGIFTALTVPEYFARHALAIAIRRSLSSWNRRAGFVSASTMQRRAGDSPALVSAKSLASASSRASGGRPGAYPWVATMRARYRANGSAAAEPSDGGGGAACGCSMRPPRAAKASTALLRQPRAGGAGAHSEALQAGEDNLLQRPHEDLPLARAREHAVAEERLRVGLRLAAGEEAFVDGAGEHRRNPGGQEGHVVGGCLASQVRPAHPAVHDLVAGDLVQDLADPGLGLFREQGGEGGHALGLGEAARRDHLVEDGGARPQARRRDRLVRRAVVDRLAIGDAKLRAEGGVPALVFRGALEERRHGGARIERGDRRSEALEPARRLPLHARAERPRLAGLTARPAVHQPVTPPPASAVPPSASCAFAVPPSGEAPPSRPSGVFSAPARVWLAPAHPEVVPTMAAPSTSSRKSSLNSMVPPSKGEESTRAARETHSSFSTACGPRSSPGARSRTRGSCSGPSTRKVATGVRLRPGGLVGVPLLAELKRRRVFRALLGYAIVAFAVLQVAEPIMHGLQLPDWTLSFVVVALGVGFPLVLVLAWVFDVSSSGIERTLPLGTEGGSRPSGALLALLATGLALLGVAAMAWHFVSRTRPGRAVPSASAPAAPSVAVLSFVNISREKDDEYFSDGITEEVINALANVEGVRVVSRTSAFAFKGKN